MKKRIMFVDDEQRVLDSLRRLLRTRCDDWEMTFVDRPESVCDRLKSAPCDVVVSDIKMPGLDGLGLLANMRQNGQLHDIPVVLLTGMADRTLKRHALDLGAADLLNKPVDPADLIARIESLLRQQEVEEEQRAHAQTLERMVEEQSSELVHSQLEVIWRLGAAAEQRDEMTGNHVVRVACYSRVIAETMGMDRDFTDTLFLAAPLHDVGKIGISDTILLKRGPLSPAEWTAMREHCVIGARIMTETPKLRSAISVFQGAGALVAEDTHNPFVKTAAAIALTHHEKWDGTGYPQELAGEAIPIEARIVAIADVYDALTSARPYRQAFSDITALKAMSEMAAAHFDPCVYAAFLRALPRIQSLRRQFNDDADMSANCLEI